MKVVILAAGRGSRMGEETTAKPKCLIQFKGATLLQHALGNLEPFFDPKDILVIGGYRCEMLRDYWPLIRNNYRWANTNIMGSLTLAANVLSQEEVLVIYSDIYFEKSAIQLMLESTRPGILNLLNWKKIWESRFANPLEDLENFDAHNCKVTRIGGKPSNLEEVNGQFGGIYTLNPDYWNVVKKIPNLENMDTTSSLDFLIKNGKTFSAIPYGGEWAEFDSIADLHKQAKNRTY